MLMSSAVLISERNRLATMRCRILMTVPHLEPVPTRGWLPTSCCASLLAVLIGAVFCAMPANAQKTKGHRVAFISGISPLSELKGPEPSSPAARAFVYGLRDLGY